MTCPDFATLVDYWFGDLDATQQDTFEDHLFGCEHCTTRLAELVHLGAGIRTAFRTGAVRAILPHALLEAMRRASLRLREYRLTPGSSVNCTIASTDDFVVATLHAPHTGVQRVDLVHLDDHGTPDARLEDIPFDPSTGTVLLAPASASLKQRSAFTDRIRLIAVDAAAERTLGEYTFLHTAERH